MLNVIESLIFDMKVRDSYFSEIIFEFSELLCYNINTARETTTTTITGGNDYDKLS